MCQEMPPKRSSVYLLEALKPNGCDKIPEGTVGIVTGALLRRQNTGRIQNMRHGCDSESRSGESKEEDLHSFGY